MQYTDTQKDVATLVELLRGRALRQPDRIAYTFLTDGETSEVQLTYSELDRRARAVAALLQHNGITEGQALLLYPPGLDFIVAFYGCLYAGVVAVPSYPPSSMRLDRSLGRLRLIAQDARPSVALTTTLIAANAEAVRAQAPDFGRMRWLPTDTLNPAIADTWQQPVIESSTLAFLQYSSGSTGIPKGVMLTHGNLMHNSAVISGAFETSENSVLVSWLPFYHDMGLIGGIIQPLYRGFPVTLMSPVDFLQRPIRWLQAITRVRATISGGPNFAYDLCVQRINAEQRAALDLSSWRLAFNGAEPVRRETLERFATTFAECGLRPEALNPCYGLAEATLLVTGARPSGLPVVQIVDKEALQHGKIVASAESESAQGLVSSGQLQPGQTVTIVDPETLTRCPADHVGEIWVMGESVAEGYWNRPEQTAATFQGYTADTGEGPFLRTGDLGFVKDNELFVTGRLKDLIIVRGRNHYPQDIELTIERSHPAIRPGCSAAFSVDIDGEERLVVAAEIDRRFRPSTEDQSANENGEAEQRTLAAAAVIKALRQAIAQHHELQLHDAVLLKPGGVPKTSSGKIQRHACKTGFLTKTLKVWGE